MNVLENNVRPFEAMDDDLNITKSIAPDRLLPQPSDDPLSRISSIQPVSKENSTLVEVRKVSLISDSRSIYDQLRGGINENQS